MLGAVDTYAVSSLYSQGFFRCLSVDCGWNIVLLAVVLGMGGGSLSGNLNGVMTNTGSLLPLLMI